jgi:hypothetical protein
MELREGKENDRASTIKHHNITSVKVEEIRTCIESCLKCRGCMWEVKG